MDVAWWNGVTASYNNHSRVVLNPDEPHPDVNVSQQLNTPTPPHPPQGHHSQPISVKQEVFMPYKCTLCNIWTENEILLKEHVTSVHFVSVQTQTSFSQTPSNISSTSISRSGRKKLPSRKSKKFFCSKCEFRTGQKQSLDQHVMSVHDKLRPFECPQCDYTCARKQNLEKHVQGVHDRAKPFTCTVCDASFSQRITLSNHIRGVHEKAKPFLCPHCDYRCAYRGNLNMHVMTVHEKLKPFSCDKCSYSCTQRSAIKRHVIGVHGKADVVTSSAAITPDDDKIIGHHLLASD